MPPRRSHRKSHSGCLQCKRRHVKCDESRPTCGPCTKRELVCHFQPNSGFGDGQLGSDGSQDQLRDRSHGPLPARTLELKLLHHFITNTYKTFFPRDEGHVQCWQVHVPDMAFEHTFLLDSVLAISALHLAHLETGTKKSWLQTALRYQDLTLAGLNKALSSINLDNCEAIALCSILVLTLSIAIPGVCKDPNGEASRSPIADLSSHRKLIQGMEIICAQSEVVLRNGVLKDFFQPIFDPETVIPRPVNPGAEEVAFANGHKLCPYVLESLSRLKIEASKTHTQYQEDFHQGCRLLEEIISPLSTLSHGPAISWPQKISPSIFMLLERNDPLACLLFLHYGVLLDIFSYWWYTRNAGRRLVKALLPYSSAVDYSWRRTVEWAKATVGVMD
ncbi:hypothetical protein BKA65DRAFT_263638 [Rhexocercosporidium sp. MPI-PUGE-AT-0058]|nr:hypothetical protein BKA65DRAFT_263638 [Rhexocercosporidium sp. MPI-PUGE-AT-0058]